MNYQYHFVSVYLPELRWQEEPPMSWHELKTLLEDNLYSVDLRLLEKLLRVYDWMNVKASWLGIPYGPFGNWEASFLETLDLETDELPPRFLTFLEEYPQKKERLEQFDKFLMEYYFATKAKGFLASYLQMEGKLKLYFALLRAKEMGLHPQEMAPFSSSDAPFAQNLLAEWLDKGTLEGELFQKMASLYAKHKKNPLALDEEVDAYKFSLLQEMNPFEYFSIDKILSFVVQFLLLEKREAQRKFETKKNVQELVVGE